MRLTTSAAEVASRVMRSAVIFARSTLGGLGGPANAGRRAEFATIAASGWLTSWAIEAESSARLAAWVARASLSAACAHARSSPVLALGQVDDEGHASVSLLVECGNAHQHGHARLPSLAQVLLLEREGAPRHSRFRGPPCVALVPSWRNQGGRAQAALRRDLSLVSHQCGERRRWPSMIDRPSGSAPGLMACHMKVPMMLASTNRQIFASRSATSRYRPAFSSAIAAWRLSSLRMAVRACTTRGAPGCFPGTASR